MSLLAHLDGQTVARKLRRMLAHQLRMGETSHVHERLRDEVLRAGGDPKTLERLAAGFQNLIRLEMKA